MTFNLVAFTLQCFRFYPQIVSSCMFTRQARKALLVIPFAGTAVGLLIALIAIIAADAMLAVGAWFIVGYIIRN